jgi:hypothetical protein
MLVDNRDVPQVHLPHHIKQIAEYRNGAEPSFTATFTSIRMIFARDKPSRTAS